MPLNKQGKVRREEDERKGIKGWGRRWWRRLLCHCRRQRRGRQREITANLSRAFHTHTPLNFPALLQQNKNDKMQPLLPNPSFLRLSKLSGGMLSWLIISARAEAQTNWTVIIIIKETLKKWYTKHVCYSHTHIDRQYIDRQLGKPFLISHGKRPES